VEHRTASLFDPHEFSLGVNLWEFGVEEIETALDVLLADEPVGSLRAGDEIAFDVQQFKLLVALGARQEVERCRRRRHYGATKQHPNKWPQLCGCVCGGGTEVC
jgi:hypothetical protein